MTNHEEQANYLAGTGQGLGLRADERAALDRIGNQLKDASLWEEPASDGQFRLLAAATQESRADLAAGQSSIGEEVATPGDAGRTADPAKAGDSANASGTPASTDRSHPRQGADLDRDDGVVSLLDRRRSRRERTAWFGAGAVVAAAAAAIALVATGQLGTGFGLNQDDATIDSELAVAATYELMATDLDPDTVASVDVVPTQAGVEFRLKLAGLDNAEGPDYYAAWLAGPDEMIPLGSFHWRKGGIEIVLWSGIDDPEYSQFMVTRQTQGDGGMPSGEVVLMGSVPDLTGDG